MAISVPGMDKAAAEKLVATAHEVCPYSNATRGNMPEPQAWLLMLMGGLFAVGAAVKQRR